jgi:ketosteroid isomerase-like protein
MGLFIACQPQTATRQIISADKINQTAYDFRRLTDANRAAHNAHDFEAIEALFTDDIYFRDVTFGDNITNIKDFMKMTRNFLGYFPDLQWKTTDYFIGSQKMVTIDAFWGGNWGMNPDIVYTEEAPLMHVFIFEKRDNRISSWQAFYGFDFLNDNGLLSAPIAAEMQSWPSTYAAAWSSLDPEAVGDLYAKDAIRQDALFEESQEGRSAIQTFAKAFFAWHPNAIWTPQMLFGEKKWRDKPQAVGSTFSIQLTDPNSKVCEITAIVLLHVMEGQIVQEEVYYKPESLLRCGWAQ